MRFFRYREDRAPVLLIALLFACDLAVFTQVHSLWLLAAWTVAGIIPKGWVCAWNHHHQHLATFHVAWMNGLLELVYGLQTGMTSRAWVLHHVLGHHVNYLDQTRDESAWMDANGKAKGVIRYAAEVAFTAYPRAWAVGLKHRHHLPAFLGGIALTVGLLATGLYFRPAATLLVFIVPMVLSLLVTAWATYTHHAERPMADHFDASTNILNRTYNLLTGNLGYHTAHHYRSGVHWSQLPALHETIKSKISADAYLNPWSPVRWRQEVEPGGRAPPRAAPQRGLETLKV